MSLTYGFYNSQNGDRRYDAEQLSSIFDGIVPDGIFASIGDKFMVYEASGMSVTVGSGRAWFNRTWTLNDSPLTINIDQSNVNLNRIDTIVLDVDKKSRVNSIIVVRGTASSTPTPPTLIVDALNEHYQYPLCDIYVAARVTEIKQENITNRVGVDCPFSTTATDLEGLVNSNKKPTFKTLWTNASQASSFSAQTISGTSFIGNSFVIVRCRLNTNYGWEQTILIGGGSGGVCYFPGFNVEGGATNFNYWWASRQFTYDAGGIKIGHALKGNVNDASVTPTVDDSFVVPIAIYGLKFN